MGNGDEENEGPNGSENGLRLMMRWEEGLNGEWR